MTMPEHLFVSSEDGALYDTRHPQWSRRPPLRPVFDRHFRDIRTTAELKATLRAGAFAWPGGYPLYFVTDDGGALSFATVREELALVLDAITRDDSNGWRVVGCDVNYEDANLYDDHTGDRIPSAYAEDH